jgi:hypothetical protein
MNKITKILGLGILFLFAMTLSLSAQNCSFSKDETDKFTNARVLHTKRVNVISKAVKVKKTYTINKIEMQIKYENNTYRLSLTYHFYLGTTAANTNSKLILLLSDGSKMEVPCLQNIPSYEGYAVSYDFGLEVTDVIKLLESDITDIRMTSVINPVEFSIDPKIKTTELFNCIYNNK